MNKTFSLEQLSQPGNLDSKLITRQSKKNNGYVYGEQICQT